MPGTTQSMANDLQVTFVETYTPAGTTIVSPFTTKTLAYAFFMTDTDCNVTATFLGGNSQLIAVKAGIPYPFAVTKITAVSAGAIYILHNGKQP